MIVLYVKDGCPHCRKQMEQLEQEGLSYRLCNVRDSAVLKEVKEKYGAAMVPVMVENGKVKAVGYRGRG